MHKYLLLLLILISATIAESQNVFNSADLLINYNSGAAPGSAANPNASILGMQKWVYTHNAGHLSWDESKFKAYFWRPLDGGIPLAFRLRYPNNYDPAKKYPVLLFFHGAGEIGAIT